MVLKVTNCNSKTGSGGSASPLVGSKSMLLDKFSSTSNNAWEFLNNGWPSSHLIIRGRLYKTLNHFFNHYFVVK
jgi:hypothetical protein